LALGQWCALSLELSPAILSLFEDAMPDEKKLDRIKLYLRSLSIIAESLQKSASKKRSSLEKLATPLMKLQLKIKTKPTYRTENLCVFYILTILSESNNSINQQAEKEGLWTYLFSQNSFFAAEGFGERLDSSVLPLLLNFIKKIGITLKI
jgi:hypothetical protein